MADQLVAPRHATGLDVANLHLQGDLVPPSSHRSYLPACAGTIPTPPSCVATGMRRIGRSPHFDSGCQEPMGQFAHVGREIVGSDGRMPPAEGASHTLPVTE